MGPPQSMGPPPPAGAHGNHPHSQAGGGATTPPPPDERLAPAGLPPDEQSAPAGLTQDSQGSGSPSLLSLSLLEGDQGFEIATVACGLRTTPPHAAVIPRPLAPSPMTTKNSFAALFNPDLPPPPAAAAVAQPTVEQLETSWKATWDRLDETNRILRSAVEKLTANAAAT